MEWILLDGWDWHWDTTLKQFCQSSVQFGFVPSDPLRERKWMNSGGSPTPNIDNDVCEYVCIEGMVRI